LEEDKTQTYDYAYYYGSIESMNVVDERLEQLINAILESDEYKRYQEIREKIKLEPEKEQAIHNFRKRNFRLQKSRNTVDLFGEIDRLEREFAEFRRKPLVEEYLSAELAMCRLIQKVNHRTLPDAKVTVMAPLPNSQLQKVQKV